MMTTDQSRPTFSGHETFPFRATWLKKAVDQVREDPAVFSRDDATVRLGVGKNMVKSMRHWALAFDLIREAPASRALAPHALEVTEFGDKLFGETGWDPYLEDPGTLWLLHWQLARNPRRSGAWYYAFNLAPKSEFSRQELARWILVWAETQTIKIAGRSLERDTDCFVRSYVTGKASRSVPLEDILACPLTELGIIRPLDVGRYVIERGDHPGLPDELIAAALGAFLKDRSIGLRTIALEDIAFSPGAPGKVFALTEDALLRRLEQLGRATDGKLVFDDTAGLRQILVADNMPSWMDLIGAYYDAQIGTVATKAGNSRG